MLPPFQGMADPRVLLAADESFDFHQLSRAEPYIRDAIDGVAREVVATTDMDDLFDLDEFDVFVDYFTYPPQGDYLEAVRSFVADGGGYVGIHCAADHSTFVDDPVDAMEELIGGAFIMHPDQSEEPVVIVDHDHPITAGIVDFTVWEEPYDVRWAEDNHILARMDHPELGDVPVAWTRTFGDGCVFYCSLGHTEDALGAGPVQTMYARGVEWVSQD